MSQPADPASRLRHLAQRLREADHLDPEAQKSLADILDELSKSLVPGPESSEQHKHLAESAAHLAEALHQQRDTGLIARARRRLEEAAVRAEAPVATGIVRRLIDTLANLGI